MDEFDEMFNKAEDTTPKKIVETKPDVQSIQKVSFNKPIKRLDCKKLGDYSDCDEVKAELKKAAKVKVKHDFSKHKKDLFKIAIFVVVVAFLGCLVFFINEVKFQSSYSNNVTVESDTITVPAPVVNNQYTFNPTTNVTVEAAEPAEINVNCDYSNQSS